MVAPAVAIIVAAGIAAASALASSASGAASSKRAAERRAKSTKRDTYAGLLQDTQQRQLELEQQRMKSSRRVSKRKNESLQNTADMIRGAFNI